jgi:hypothetical protein
VPKPCPCPLPPTGFGISALVMPPRTWSRPDPGMLDSESRFSSSGDLLVSAVLSSPTSASLKPRACLLNRSMSCTMMESSPGNPLNGCPNLTTGSRSAGRAVLQTLRTLGSLIALSTAIAPWIPTLTMEFRRVRTPRTRRPTWFKRHSVEIMYI